MENQSKDFQISSELFYKHSYDAWIENKIRDIDTVLPTIDKNMSLDDFKSLVEIVTFGSINKIAQDIGFYHDEIFITCFDSEILITNKRLFISKVKDINLEYDWFFVGRIFSVEYFTQRKLLVFRFINKKATYEDFNDYSKLQEIINQLKKSQAYNSINYDNEIDNSNKKFNKEVKKNSKVINKPRRNEKEEHNISEILNLGSLIGAVGIVFLIYKIAPHISISNFLYIIILIVGGLVGGYIYGFLSKLK